MTLGVGRRRSWRRKRFFRWSPRPADHDDSAMDSAVTPTWPTPFSRKRKSHSRRAVVHPAHHSTLFLPTRTLKYQAGGQRHALPARIQVITIPFRLPPSLYRDLEEEVLARFSQDSCCFLLSLDEQSAKQVNVRLHSNLGKNRNVEKIEFREMKKKLPPPV